MNGNSCSRWRVAVVGGENVDLGHSGGLLGAFSCEYDPYGLDEYLQVEP